MGRMYLYGYLKFLTTDMEFATLSAQVPYLTSTDEYSVMDGKVLWPCSNSRAG